MNQIRRQLAYNISARTGGIRYIVIHDTGNSAKGANAEAHFQYFNGGDRGSSADIFVDDTSVWYVNNYTQYYSWHCGDGGGSNGITNRNSVGIELCINQDGNYEAAFANMVEVIRKLMKELNIPAERVVRHFDASNKACPQSMSDDNWQRWKSLKEILEKEDLTMSQYEELNARIDKLENPMIYNYIDDNMPDWARPTIQKLVDKGILKGDGEGLNLTEEMLRILVILDRINEQDT